MFRKNKLLSALFDGDLYMVCLISILRLLKLGVASDPDQHRKNLAITLSIFTSVLVLLNSELMVKGSI